MTVKDIFYSICNDRGISFSQAARNIGVSKGSLWNQLDKKDGMAMYLNTLIRDLGELECEIYIVDSQTDEEYILDGEDEDVELFTKQNRDNSW